MRLGRITTLGVEYFWNSFRIPTTPTYSNSGSTNCMSLRRLSICLFDQWQAGGVLGKLVWKQRKFWHTLVLQRLYSASFTSKKRRWKQGILNPVSYLCDNRIYKLWKFTNYYYSLAWEILHISNLSHCKVYADIFALKTGSLIAEKTKWTKQTYSRGNETALTAVRPTQTLACESSQHNTTCLVLKGLEDERWCWCGTCFRSFQRLWNPELQWLRHWAYCRGNRAAFEKGTDSLLNAGMATGCTLLCNGPWSSERPGKTLHSLHTLAFQQERTKQKHLTYICILMLY